MGQQTENIEIHATPPLRVVPEPSSISRDVSLCWFVGSPQLLKSFAGCTDILGSLKLSKSYSESHYMVITY